MPVMQFTQVSVFDPQHISEACLEEGTLPWFLARAGEWLIPRYLAAEWRGAGRMGRNAWPARVHLSLCLLRTLDGGHSRKGATRRARTDLAWRAAMGLSAGGKTPGEKSVREFEAWLIERAEGSDVPRYELFSEWIATAALASCATGERIWMMDSTPMFCFGALRGTVRLLGDGLRSLAKRFARWTGTNVVQLAKKLGIPWLKSKSTKGGLDIDWRDGDARRKVVHQLATDVQTAIAHVLDHVIDVPLRHRENLRGRCDALLKVINDDLETDQDGNLVVARRATSDRIVSITDPDARSGRKSQQQPFKGFKLNLLGDLVSGVITAVKVVAGNVGDGGVGIELLRSAKKLRLRMTKVFGDTAYGGVPTRLEAAMLGVEIVAPGVPIPSKGDVLQKHQFDIDFENRVATCPAGVSTDEHDVVHKGDGPQDRYSWPVTACASCPLRPKCVPSWKQTKNRGRPRRFGKRLLLHPHEDVLRAARKKASELDFKLQYRRRGEGERLVDRLTRRGARQANAFGLIAANLQAHLTTMAANLCLLAQACVDRGPPRTTLPLFGGSY